MVKFFQVVMTLSLVAGPVIAIPGGAWENLDHHFAQQRQHRRELSIQDPVFAREADFDAGLYGRFNPEEEFEIRELDIQDLSERNFFKKLWHGVKKAASFVIREDMEDLDMRELDELYERDMDEIEAREEGIEYESRSFEEPDLEISTRGFADDDYEFEGREFDDLD